MSHVEIISPRSMQLRDQVQPQGHLVATVVVFHLWPQACSKSICCYDEISWWLNSLKKILIMSLWVDQTYYKCCHLRCKLESNHLQSYCSTNNDNKFLNISVTDYWKHKLYRFLEDTGHCMKIMESKSKAISIQEESGKLTNRTTSSFFCLFVCFGAKVSIIIWK
jgi:hypothetical protein